MYVIGFLVLMSRFWNWLKKSRFLRWVEEKKKGKKVVGKSRFLRRVLCKRNTQYGSLFFLFFLDFLGVVIFFLNSPLGFWFDEAGVRICEEIEVLSEKLFRALKKKRYMLWILGEDSKVVCRCVSAGYAVSTVPIPRLGDSPSFISLSCFSDVFDFLSNLTFVSFLCFCWTNLILNCFSLVAVSVSCFSKVIGCKVSVLYLLFYSFLSVFLVLTSCLGQGIWFLLEFIVFLPFSRKSRECPLLEKFYIGSAQVTGIIENFLWFIWTLERFCLIG